MRAEGLCHLNVSKDPTRNGAQYRLSCGALLQPTAAPLAAMLIRSTRWVILHARIVVGRTIFRDYFKVMFSEVCLYSQQ